MFKIYLDNIEVTEPKGLDKLITTISRYRDGLKGLLIQVDNSIEFSNEPDGTNKPTGYSFLNDRLETDFTTLVNVTVLRSVDQGGTFTEYYKGVIFIPDVDFDRYRKIATVKLQDNTYYSFINNNKSIKVSPSSAQSKNGAAITSAPIGTMSWFRCVDGSTIQDDSAQDAKVYCFKAYDILKQMIPFLSDNRMEFESNYLSSGALSGLLITTGRAFRKSVLSAVTSSTDDFTQSFPGVSFEELLKNLSRLSSLNFYIDRSGPKPVLRYELENYFNDSQVLIELENIEELTRYVDVSQLYSTIKFGSKKIIDRDAEYLHFVDGIRWAGFGPDNAAFIGTNNINATLDYTLSYITSSNVIEYIYENAIPSDEEDLDKEIILISATEISPNIYEPTKTNWITSLPYRYYNELLTNNEICNRLTDGLPNTIVSSISPVDNRFSATNSAASGNIYAGTPIDPIQFNTVVNDAGGNYNPFTFFYEAPEPGSYSFECTTPIKLQLFGGAPLIYSQLRYMLFLNKYDSSMNLLNTFTMYDSFNVYGGYKGIATGTQFIETLTGNATINMNTTDLVQPSLVVTDNVGVHSAFMIYQLKAGGYFKCTSSATGGGVIKTVDPNKLPAIRYKFEYGLTEEQRLILINNPKGQIKFSRAGEPPQLARIEKIEIPVTGKSKILLNAARK